MLKWHENQSFYTHFPLQSTMCRPLSVSLTKSPSLLRTIRPIHKIVKHLPHHRRLHSSSATYTTLAFLLVGGGKTYLLSLITYRILKLRTPHTLMCARARLLLRSQLGSRTRRVVIRSPGSTVRCLDILDAWGLARDQISEGRGGFLVLGRHGWLGSCCSWISWLMDE